MSINKNNIIIGKNLRQIRISQNLSPLYVAEKSNYSSSNISKFENGALSFDCNVLKIFCKIYHCTPDAILSGIEDIKASDFASEIVCAQGDFSAKAATLPASQISFLDSFSETQRRRLFRIIYLYQNLNQCPLDMYYHNLFGSCELDKTIINPTHHLSFLLEWERKKNDCSRRAMATHVGISKNSYYKILNQGCVTDIHTLIKIQKILHYPLHFLLNNTITAEMFFSPIAQYDPIYEKHLLNESISFFKTRNLHDLK